MLYPILKIQIKGKIAFCIRFMLNNGQIQKFHNAHKSDLQLSRQRPPLVRKELMFEKRVESLDPLQLHRVPSLYIYSMDAYGEH